MRVADSDTFQRRCPPVPLLESGSDIMFMVDWLPPENISADRMFYKLRPELARAVIGRLSRIQHPLVSYVVQIYVRPHPPVATIRAFCSLHADHHRSLFCSVLACGAEPWRSFQKTSAIAQTRAHVSALLSASAEGGGQSCRKCAPYMQQSFGATRYDGRAKFHCPSSLSLHVPIGRTEQPYARFNLLHMHPSQLSYSFAFHISAPDLTSSSCRRRERVAVRFCHFSWLLSSYKTLPYSFPRVHTSYNGLATPHRLRAVPLCGPADTLANPHTVQ
eukprot:IDg18235t1